MAEESLTIGYDPLGEARIFTLEAWIERIRVQVWSVAFDDELKKVDKNLKPVDQPGLKKAVARTVFRYFTYILLPRKIVSSTPVFFDTYLDLNATSCMITESITKK